VTKDERRFWASVSPDANGCWEWLGSKAAGYGRFRLNGRLISSHRVSYEMAFGPIPKGLYIDHICCNPSCVNPYHLDPVTHVENVMRGTWPPAVNKRKTHCLLGHEYTPENTINRHRPGCNPERQCRTCKTEWYRQHPKRKPTRASR